MTLNEPEIAVVVPEKAHSQEMMAKDVDKLTSVHLKQEFVDV